MLPFGSSAVPSSATILPLTGRLLQLSKVSMLVSGHGIREGVPDAAVFLVELLTDVAGLVEPAGLPTTLRFRAGCEAAGCCVVVDTLFELPDCCSLGVFATCAAFGSSVPALRELAPPRGASPFTAALD